MQITLNGTLREVDENLTVSGLLAELDLSRQRVAVLLDDEVVRKADFEETRLAEGARVELITMVGGG